MSEIKLSNITSEFPRERETIKRLESYLNSDELRGDREVTLERLGEITNPSSMSALAMLLALLVRAGILEQKVRVESPSSQGGIDDFPSMLDVPSTIHDWRTDKELQVTPDNLRVIYRLLRE